MLRSSLVFLVCVAACVPKRDAETAKQLTRIEEKLAAQDKAIAEAKQGDFSVEIAALAQRIEDLTAQIVALQDKLAKQPAPPPKRRSPNPTAVYAYPIASSPTLGSPKAKVTMVMVFEFACGYCRKAWDTVDALRKKYGKNLRVVYRQFVVHPAAKPAALAACAAELQGKWRKTADLLWQKAHDPHKYEQENVDAIALEAGLDIARYQADIAGACPTQVADDNELARKFALGGTPGFFINGRYVSGAKDQRTFEILIDEEMRKSDAALKAGAKPENLYDQEVLGKGLPEVPPP